MEELRQEIKELKRRIAELEGKSQVQQEDMYKFICQRMGEELTLIADDAVIG